MDIDFEVSTDPSGDELRSLRHWLVNVPEFRGRVSLQEAPPHPGEMGRGLDAVRLALAEASQRTADALVQTLDGWLSTRPEKLDGRRTELKVKIADGVIIASLSTGMESTQLESAFATIFSHLITLSRGIGETNGAKLGTTARSGVELGLAEEEATALAATFDSRQLAMFLLHQADLSPALFPTFDTAPHPNAYWSEVGRLLALGRVPGGRHRLLAAAAKEYPAHPVFNKPDPTPATE